MAPPQPQPPAPARGQSAARNQAVVQEDFSAYDGVYKLASERAPQVRVSQVPGYTGTSFSWAPALPGGAQLGEGGRSDAGFLVYNVGDVLQFTDQRAASGEQPDALQLRARPTCHDLHWCERPATGGAGSPELELLIGFLSGEVILWRPLHRRDAARGGLTPVCKEGADGGAVTVVKWLPYADACFVTAHSNGRLQFYDRRRPEDAHSPSRDGSRGRRLRRGGSDGAVRHSAAAVWQAGDAAINALAFSADGTRLALGGADGVLTVYDLGHYERLPTTEKVLVRFGSHFSWLKMASTLSTTPPHRPPWTIIRLGPLLLILVRRLSRVEAHRGLRSSPLAAPRSRILRFQPPGTLAACCAWRGRATGGTC